MRGGRVCMEEFVEEFQIGKVKIQLSIKERQGLRMVIFTVLDEENRRIMKTPLMVNGEVKKFEREEDAITEAKRTLGAL